MLRCALLGLLLTVSMVAGTNYPLYKQCDPRWANDLMGVPGQQQATICQQGCAMTDAAMALASLGVTIGGSLVHPGNLNTWLKQNGGYLCISGDCNNLNLSATEQLSPVMNLVGEMPKPAYVQLANEVGSPNGMVFIAHVRDNTHFVLLTAPASNRSFFVNDPLYQQTIYSYDNITDVIQYKVDVYPVYKQCNSSWGSSVMGGDHDTICQVGCLMSSVSMALAGTSIPINGRLSTPAVLNTWLQNNNGYVTGSSSMEESAIPKINPAKVSWPSDGMHPTNDLPLSTIVQYLSRPVPRIVIANVMQGQHFVLIVGWRANNDTLVVNDPGFNRNTYSYLNDVVGWRIFDMI